MVAIVAGTGLGLFNASPNTLDGNAVPGHGLFGQSGGRFHVNVATGNLVLQAPDEYLSGRGLGLAHLRTYNSQGAPGDGDGDGWRWHGERSVVLPGAVNAAGSTVTRTDGDGHTTVYTWDSSRLRYVSTEGGGAHDTIAFDTGPQLWQWVDGSSRLVEKYSSSTGKLLSQHDLSGNSIGFQYDGSGRLSGVTDSASGQRLVLVYATVPGNASLVRLKRVETVALTVDGSGRPTNVLGASVKRVEYAYDVSGRLTSVRTDLTPGDAADNAFYVTNYTYDGGSIRIASVVQSDGTSISFTYDGSGRVGSVTDDSGTLTFSYTAQGGAGAGTTMTTDVSLDAGDGNQRVWTYVCDGEQRLAEVRTPAPAPGGARLSTRFQYDAAGNVLRVVDARGLAVDYEYDALGNRRLERDSQGNTVVRTFDGRNQLATETFHQTADPDGAGQQPAGNPVTRRFVYDQKSRLRFVVGAEGGVEEYRYGTAGASLGRRTQAIAYTGGRYDVSGLTPQTVPTEDQMTAWAAGQAKDQVELTEFVYDLRGDVSRRTDFGAVDASGAGILDAAAVVTEYAYDARGDLLQAIVVHGNARDRRVTQASVVRDGLGRQVQLVDAAGTRATVYDGAKRSILVTTQAGLVVSSSGFDNRGRLVSVGHSGSGSDRATQYVYDAAGRLRLVTDPQGGRRVGFYDGAGRVRFQVDSVGVVTGFEYDANGQVTVETHYHIPADTSGWYDQAANTVTKHTLTIGTDVVADAARDRVVKYAYDSANRLSTVTDPVDVGQLNGYDGRSLMTFQQIGNRITQFFYDRDGRLAGTVDPSGFLTESIFDAGGRVVETVRYRTRSPAVTNRASPEWVGVVNQTATGGRAFEYRIPAFDADGDELVYRVVGNMPSWLTLDTSTGIAILTGTPPTAPATYTVTVQADDQRGRTGNVTVGIAVVNTPPAWATLPDSVVAVNASYSLVLPPATDIESAANLLTYSILSTLPAGLSFNASQRRLAGIPSAPGVYAVTARVTDSHGRFTDRSFMLTVTNNGPQWAPVPMQRLIVGQPFSMTVPPAVDPEGESVSYDVDFAPGWLAFNADTRVLSGTPTSEGFETVGLLAYDPHGQPAVLTFGLKIITNDPPTWAQLPPLVTTAGSPVSYTPPAAVDPEGETLTYSAVSGLPAGLSVNSANGSIVGTTLIVDIFPVVLRATDQRGGSVDRTVWLTVKNAVPVYTGALLDHEFESRPLSLPFSFVIPPGAFVDPNGDPLIYVAQFAPSKPNWINFNASTLTFSGFVPGGLNFGVQVDITVTVIDTHFGGASGTFRVRVSKNLGNQLVDPDPDPETDSAGGMEAVASSVASSLVEDVLAPWRPANTDGLRGFLFYDGVERVVGAVDERGFLSEIIYDAEANKQHNVRYLNPVSVDATDTLATLKAKAGSAKLTETVEFDDFGRVSRVVAADGTVTRSEYDGAGRLVREVHADGSGQQQSARVRYNAHGEVTGMLGGVGEATLPANPSVAAVDAAIAEYGMRYEFDGLGRRAKAIDANGNTTLYFYDPESRLTQVINAEGEVVEMAYTPQGETASVRRYAARITSANLGALNGGPASQLQGKLPAVDEAKDQIIRYEYDRRGLLVKRTDGEGFVTTHTYTPHGQVATQTRAIGQNRTVTTRFDHDHRGALVSLTADLGGINANQRTAYDEAGRVIRSVDPTGAVTTTTYGDGGRTVEVTDALGRTVRTEYDSFGRPRKRFDAAGRQTVYEYDDTERTVTVTSPEGVRVTTRMTPHGQAHTVIDSRGGTTTYEYDTDGRLTSVKDPLGRLVLSNDYDKSGRLRQSTDANGRAVVFGYDEADRLIQRTVDDDKLVSGFDVDALGRQVKATDTVTGQVARAISYEYDRNGRLKQVVVDPDGLRLSTRYTFDGLGNTVTVEQGMPSNPAQYVVRYEFDNLGRQVRQIVAPSDVMGAGAPHTRDITTEFRYDAAGRVSRVIDPAGESTWYVYDAAGQRTHVINAEGEVTRNTYDVNGRLVQTRRYLNRLGAGVLADLGDVPGPVEPATHSLDQRTCLVYDKDTRLRFTLAAMRGSNWTISEIRYDGNGNVVETRRYHKFLQEARIGAINAAQGATVASVVAELESLGCSENASAPAGVRSTRFAYDASNRLRFTVDALGAVSENIYDTGGNMVAHVRYAAKPNLSGYTASAINAAVNRKHADNQVTHLAYDTAGRVRYILRVLVGDGQGTATKHLVRELIYDAFGRITQRAQYAKVVGVLPDYRLSTVAGAITADPQDRREAFVYDKAGRQVYRVRVLSPGALGKHLVERTDFDALGRAVRHTAYAKELGLVDLTEATLNIAAAVGASFPDRTTSVVYDAAGRLRFVVGPDGSLSETVYDAAGRVGERRQFDVHVPSSTPRTEGALPALRASRAVGDGMTRGERYTYDRAGRVVTVTDAKNVAQANGYSGLGDMVSHTDRNGHTCLYSHDRLGRVVVKTSPQVEASVRAPAQSTPEVMNVLLQDEWSYDAFDNVISMVERANTGDSRQTRYSHDIVGRLFATLLPGNFDPATGLVERAEAAGRFRREVTVTYDVLGNAVRTRTRIGVATYQFEYKTYDPLGREVYDVDALNHVTAFMYTPFDEQEQVTRHGVAVTGAPGNASFWTTAEIAAKVAGDAKARTVTTSYDNAGRKAEVRQPAADYHHGDGLARPNATSVTPVTDQATTRYFYNAFGEVRHEAVKQNTTEWRDTRRYFDVMGRQVRVVDARSHHTTQVYDAFGNVVRTVEYAEPGMQGSDDVDQPGVNDSDDDRITGYTYDVLNQRTSIRRLGARYIGLNGGNYLQVEQERSFPTTLQSFTYDGLGRVLTQTDGLGNVTSFAYNALGQLIRTIEPLRETARPGNLDPFHNPVTAAPVTTLTLDAFGNVVGQRRTPEGGAGEILVVQYSYDAVGNLVGTMDARENTKLRRFDYAGRVVRETQAVNETLAGWLANDHTLERRYVYDASGHQTHTLDVFLDGAQLMQSGVRTVYSAFGEVVEERMVWGSAATAVDGLNSALVTKYSYDNTGHLIEKVAAEGTTRYHYSLAAQVTRQEQLGDNPGGGTKPRITETGYDLLGFARIQRRPSFTALTTTSQTAVTTLTEQNYDRWGNVILRSEGRYVRDDDGTVLGLSATTTYTYNADNRLAAERLPIVTTWRADGINTPTRLRHELRYDLDGRVVQEIDLSEALVPTDKDVVLRVRNRRYSAIGQMVAETDGTGIITRYAYDAHGNRVGVGNAVGIVLVDTFDRNGNVLTHSVLRQADGNRYVTGSGLTPVARKLNQFLYDQANRRIGSADVMNDSGTDAHWSYTKLDERSYARANRNPSGVETTCDYDLLGNKVREADANGNQTWTFSPADFTVGRSLSTTVGGNRTTTYEYDPFGAIQYERYPDANTYRRIDYHDNGLVKQVHEVLTMGTLGPVGGVDYWETDDLTLYDYTPRGQLTREKFTRTGQYEFEMMNDLGTGYDVLPVPIDKITRTTYTTYDLLGRMNTVTAPGTQVENPGRGSLNLEYRYDELGNRRNIRATFTRPGSVNSETSDLWHTYDAEGRMTVVDGTLDQNSHTIKQGHGTVITYDATGRRATADSFVKPDHKVVPTGPGQVELIKWDEFRLERYEYDDLNFLADLSAKRIRRNSTKKVNNGSTNPHPAWDFVPAAFTHVETRDYDPRGGLATRLGYDATGAVKTTTQSTYRPDGQLTFQHTADTSGVTAGSQVFYTYDGAGVLREHKYRQFAVPNKSPEYTNTYTYTYGMEFGGYKEDSITVNSTLDNARNGRTANNYDPKGRLLAQSISAADGPSTARSFSYGTDDRVMTKDEFTRMPGAIGHQNFTYSQGRQVAVVGSGLLATAQFTNGYTPISASYPGVRAASHVVSDGDTLAGIAHLYFGDGSLWYLIAEANTIHHDPAVALPDTEVGRAYRIPNVVGNIHNNSTTFLPYQIVDIIGDPTPMPYLPPPPAPDALVTIVAVVAVTAIVIAVTYGAGAVATSAIAGAVGQGALATVGGAAIGSAAGNAAGQLVRMGIGQQNEFDAGSTVAAGIGGAIGAGADLAIGAGSTALGDRLARRFVSHVGQQAALSVGGLESASGGSVTALAIDLAAAGVSPYLDGNHIRWSNLAGSLATSALDPRYGWLRNDRSRDWVTIVSQAAGAFTAVAVGGLISWALPGPQSESQRVPVAGGGRVLVASLSDGDLGTGSDHISAASSLSQAELDALWNGTQLDLSDYVGEIIYVEGQAPRTLAYEELMTALRLIAAQEDANRTVAAATADLVKYEGERLRRIDGSIRDTKQNLSRARASRDSLQLSGLEGQLKREEDERQRIIDAYDPSRRSFVPNFYGYPLLELPYPTSHTPTNRAWWPLSLFKRRPTEHLQYGDAHVYNGATNGVQVASDLEMLAKMGYQEVHIFTGSHGGPKGQFAPAHKFLLQDLSAIFHTMDRYPNLRYHLYEPVNGFQVADFMWHQQLAAQRMLSGAATIATSCFSDSRMPEHIRNTQNPLRYPTIPGTGTRSLTSPLGNVHVLVGGVSAGFGALTLYDGTQDPGAVVGPYKIAVGGAELVGGAAHAIGNAGGFARLVRFGSVVGGLGNVASLPLAYVDLHRFLQQGLQPGGQVSNAEAFFGGVNLASGFAAMAYPQAVVGALAVNYVLKPVAKAGAAYVAPKFIGAMSQAYGIPEQYLWGMW